MISYASIFGMEKYKHEKNVNLINESSNLSFGKNKIKVLSLPGHSPGHIAFFFQKQKKCFCGDVIFKNSIALEPSNKNFKTRIFGEGRVKIQGKLVGLIRKF